MNVSGDQLPRNESVRGRMGDNPPPPPAPSPPESVNESAGQDSGKRRHTGPGFIPARFGRRMHTRGQDSRFWPTKAYEGSSPDIRDTKKMSGLAADNWLSLGSGLQSTRLPGEESLGPQETSECLRLASPKAPNFQSGLNEVEKHQTGQFRLAGDEARHGFAVPFNLSDVWSEPSWVSAYPRGLRFRM